MMRDFGFWRATAALLLLGVVSDQGFAEEGGETPVLSVEVSKPTPEPPQKPTQELGKEPSKGPSASQQQRGKAIESLIQSFESRFSVENKSAEELIQSGGKPASSYLFVDARSHAERVVSQIEGSVSLSDFRRDQTEDSLKNKTVVFYCTIGYRSSQAAERLQGKSFKAVNLRGGLLGWIHSGGRVVDAKGQPTKQVHVYGEAWNVLPPDYSAVH